jgi:hypothetical protein
MINTIKKMVQDKYGDLTIESINKTGSQLITTQSNDLDFRVIVSEDIQMKKIYDPITKINIFIHSKKEFQNMCDFNVPINAKFFAYVNKLTLGCILIQPIIIRYILLNARYQLYFDGWYILFYGMATFALSILINIILSLLFQIPFKQFRLFLFPELQNKEYIVIHETK